MFVKDARLDPVWFADVKEDAENQEIKPKKPSGQGFGNIFNDPKGKAVFEKIASKQGSEDRPVPAAKQVHRHDKYLHMVIWHPYN